MSDIDRLIEAMRKHQATELLIEEGKRPNFVVGGAPVPVSFPELDRAGILKILGAMLGDAGAARLEAERATNFSYTTPAGLPVIGIASTHGDAIRVKFRPDTGAGAPAEAAAAAAIAASSPGTPRLVPLLGQLLSRKGSDLHVSSVNHPVIRIDGDMVAITDYPVLSPHDVEQMLFEVTPAKNRNDFKERDDTDFALHIEGLGRFRANLFRDRKGMGGVFRVIPSHPMGADEIGLPNALVERITRLHKGLVLVTGPTGSGKSTTLTAIIDRINSVRAAHIITIEDPIEFLHDNKQCLINQREVGEHTRSFKDALRAALREDPDIILVGEMRDLETTAIAIETAETGHLVFGTLHTTTAVSTVSRVVDQFSADRQGQIRLMLADSLKVVMCQSLLKKEGGGRVAAMEILVGTSAVANLIREGKSFQLPSIMQSSRGEGMTLMADALMDLVKKKLVSPIEAYSKAVDKTAIRSLFEKSGVPLPK